MSDYVIVESRDPFEHHGVRATYELARSLVKGGRRVTLFLVQNGVLPSRQGTASTQLAELKEGGVEVLADTFSLRERGIPPERLAGGVSPAEIGTVVDALVGGRTVLFR